MSCFIYAIFQDSVMVTFGAIKPQSRTGIAKWDWVARFAVLGEGVKVQNMLLYSNVF